ncbi:MAG: NifB/NifX family molybdenum-iron cluster-binding protein [Thermodesulfobacteriota bacterium]|nr:NifB/NifX family molybdenum-iron cluster-binding protein [Thermodesulfobacteriota bacterium]
MLVAIAADGDQGMEAQAAQHFGRCSHYIIVEITDNTPGKVSSVENPFFNQHGNPGQVPAFIKDQGADVMISGGMGGSAINFFNEFKIEVCTGASGSIKNVIKAYIDGSLSGASGCTH